MLNNPIKKSKIETIKCFICIIITTVLILVIGAIALYLLNHDNCRWVPNHQPMAYGACEIIFPAIHYNKTSNRCIATQLEGCKNPSPFSSLEACASECVEK
jgi:hypothetical protein